MKKLQNSIFIILVLTLSSCFQNNFNTEGLVGNLNEVQLDERSCFESPIQPVINEKIEHDKLIDSIKIRILTFDFYEMQKNPDSNGSYYQRIDLEGITNSDKSYHAIIEFTDCNESYNVPELLYKNTGPIIKLYYPMSRLNSILKILEENQSVMLHYHRWEEAGAWAAISYHKALTK